MSSDVIEEAESRPSISPDEEGLDPNEILRILWRRKAYLVGTAGLGISIAVAYLALTVPLYTAEAIVQIEPNNVNIVGIDDVAPGLTGDKASVAGEVQVIRSREIAERTIGLAGPDIDLDLVDARATDQNVNGFKWEFLPWASAAQGPSDQLNPAQIRIRSVDRFLKRLSVTQVAGSNVISIGYSAPDPEVASWVANRVTDVYLESQIERKAETTERANTWINARLAELEATVEGSEQKVEAFRAEAGIVDGVQAPILTEQVSRLNDELAKAQAEASEAKARLEEVEVSIEEGDVDAIASVLNSPVVLDLRERAAEVSQRRAELSTQYGELHPIWTSIRAEAKEIDNSIDREVGRVVQNLASESRVAQSRVATLAERVQRLEGFALEARRASVQLRALERDAETDRRLYELFLTRFKETTLQEGIQQPDAEVISYADVPVQPSHPRSELVLAIAVVFSAALGVALALVSEALHSGGFHRIAEVERRLRLPVFGLVPKSAGGRLEELPINQPRSSYTEAIRGIRASLLAGKSIRPAPKVVVVTSAVPGEGKTTTVAALTRVLAAAGVRAVAVDCDTRRPRIHDAFGVTNGVGLVDYLAGNVAEVLVQSDVKSDAKFVTAGTSRPDSSELLDSVRFRNALSQLSRTYDIVILDSPPVVPVTDARVLVGLADAAVFVIGWGKTRRRIVQDALKLIVSRPPIFGCVLNKVDVKKLAGYGYGAGVGYYKKYREYYKA